MSDGRASGAGTPRRGLPRRIETASPADAVGAARVTDAANATDAAGAEDAAPADPPRPAPVAAGRAVARASLGQRTPMAATRLEPASVPAEAPTRTPPNATDSSSTQSVGRLSQRWRLFAVVAPLAVVGLGLLVLGARWLVTLDGVRHFLADYPGAYALPAWTPVGFPAWVGWQHFLNAFFLILIIRSGWRVRRDARPTAFWSPRWNPKRKISLQLWLHQALDVLWLGNGVVFVVLLFATGQWVRIVPTSWAVVPNAISAGLQYLSLDWPTEDGWVAFNSLQQLSYFAVVFLAAPLAAVTGVRMSGVWPSRARRLSRAYPIEVARAVHFPVMLFFVGFVVVHVTLVFATGALRNLNHLYAGDDSTGWVGFAVFAGSAVVTVAALVLARPLVVAPIANLFGKVSAR